MRIIIALTALYLVASTSVVHAQEARFPTPDQFCVGKSADDTTVALKLLAKIQELQNQLDKRKEEDAAAAKNAAP